MKAGFPISKIIASNTIFGPLVDYHGYYTQTRVYVPQIWGYSSHYCRYGATAYTILHHRYGATAYTTVPQIQVTVFTWCYLSTTVPCTMYIDTRVRIRHARFGISADFSLIQVLCNCPLYFFLNETICQNGQQSSSYFTHFILYSKLITVSFHQCESGFRSDKICVVTKFLFY